jgi:hypothetical protein
MALEVYGPRNGRGVRHHVALDDDEAHLIFQRLPAALSVAAPVCARLWDRLYDGPRLDDVAVAALRGELDAIAGGVSTRRDELRRNASDLEPFLVSSAVLVRLGQLLALCEDALTRGSGVECVSG